MDENRNPEELLLTLHNNINKMKKKSGAWDSNCYGPDQEIEAVANRDVEETSPLSSSNGLNIRNRKLSESASVPKHVQKTGPPNHIDFKPKHFHSGYRNDRRNYKDFDKRYKDNTRRPDRKEWGTPNGKINGYHTGDGVAKPMRDSAGPDNGSAQWRWKGRRNSRDSVGSLEDKSRSPVDGKEMSPKQEPDKLRVSSTADPSRPSHSSNAKPSGRYSSPASHGVKNEGEGLRKSQDGKPSAAKKPEERPKPKVSTTVVADDSWSLFKPPPVFPVDNSSAKIVPKISYASKVKENLNKAPIESVVQHPGKPVQVPASAVKTIASNGLPNGIICNASEGRLSTASSPAPPVVEQPQSHFHAPPPEPLLVSERVPVTENGPSPSSIQSNSHVDSSLPPPGQQNLGAIFQNEWGLSFINDPGADAEKSRDTSRTECIVDSFPSALGTDVPLWPVRESEIRNGANFSLDNLPVDSGNSTSPGLSCSTTLKDTEALNINHDCLDSSSPCNLEAIIHYHMKAWEQVWKRHEQDPKRVIAYSEDLERVF